jgi:hypothetical protein
MFALYVHHGRITNNPRENATPKLALRLKQKAESVANQYTLKPLKNLL